MAVIKDLFEKNPTTNVVPDLFDVPITKKPILKPFRIPHLDEIPWLKRLLSFGTLGELDRTLEEIRKEEIAKVGEEEYQKQLAEVEPIARTWDEIGDQWALNNINMRTFGLLEHGLNRMGYTIPEPETTVGKISGGLGALQGFIKGPGPAGTKLAAKTPLVGRLFAPARTGAGMVAKQIGRGAFGLGFASGMIAPEEGLIAPKERGKQFLEGFKTGAAFGGISFIPNKITRMLSTSAIIGIPSSLRQEPLEEQIFNYGLGAYYGRHGGGLKTQLAREKNLLKTLEHGFTGKNAKQFLDQNDQLLNQEARYLNTIGIDPVTKTQRMKDILSRGFRKDPLTSFGERLTSQKGKILVAKVRKNRINALWGKIKQIKARPESVLYEGDMDFVLDNINHRQDIEKFSNHEIVALTELVKPSNLPTVRNIFASQPLKRGQNINAWDAILRPGYKLMRKLGFGGIQSENLTQDFFEGDVTHATGLNQYFQLKENWIKSVGASKKTATNLFKYSDGKLHKALLNPKQARVATQMRKYLDMLLNAQNRQLTAWGEQPIEARKNYITHIFDEMTRAAQQSKHPYADRVLEAMDYITPKQKYSPFLKKRIGGKGYKQNIWEALDAYVYSSYGVVADTPIRRANKVIRYIRKEIRFNEKMGAESLYNLPKIKSHLDSYVKDYVGRPRPFDHIIRQTMNEVNRFLPEPMQINSLMRLNDLVISATYATNMGYRPKLALRNLGQHSLTIGEVGLKPLATALRKYRQLPTGKLTPEALQLLQQSKVLQSRAISFAPETAAIGRAGGAVRRETMRSLAMYKGADRINVQDSFLAGYQEAIIQGKSHAEAVKRGDMVAAKTQFLYLRGNRSHLARSLLGISRIGGRFAGVFTTWAPNWLELQLSWAKPGHREKLLRYIGLNTTAAALMGSMGIAFWEYTGLGSMRTLKNMLTQPLPFIKTITKPKIALLRDLEKVEKEDDLKEMFLYTWHWDK